MASQDELQLEFLAGLNSAQLEAVTHVPANLQILAGPGSGKTKVLVSRVAYMIAKLEIFPKEIICVTFTNKAAREMNLRLQAILGQNVANKLAHLGTFHALANKYLRQYGKLVGIDNSFSVIDASDSEKLIKRVIKENKDSTIDIQPKELKSAISKAKSSFIGPSGYVKFAGHKSPRNQTISEMYDTYQTYLTDENLLDFDDLLVYFLRLVDEHPRHFQEIQHILVDEFQDTNTIQYSILRRIGTNKKGLTIVGDPDQSIYGWRNAQIGNLDLMTKDFENVKKILLEENYRSTSSILDSALAIVKQDKNRIAKTLITSHPKGPKVTLKQLRDAQQEANFIAYEIKRLIAYTGEQFNYNDFSILIRYGAQSRPLESALRSESIPYRLVGGHKFFDRAEVKDVLSYLQLVDNPGFTTALIRVINTPKRGVGEKTMASIQKVASVNGMTPYDLIKEAADGQGPGTSIVKGKIGNQIKSFVQIIEEIKSLADSGTDVTTLIETICKKTKYEDYLKETYEKDFKERWENIVELGTFANLMSTGMDESFGFGKSEDLDETDDDDDEETGDTALRKFLNMSMLSTDTETEEARLDAKNAKVTISTAHAAKGLEWPVVFIPSVVEGVFPFVYATDNKSIDEERRLLFVAMTRAQTNLYLTAPKMRMRMFESERTTMCNFVSRAKRQNNELFVTKSEISGQMRQQISDVLGRDSVPDSYVTTKISEFDEMNKFKNFDNEDMIPNSQSQYFSPTGEIFPIIPRKEQTGFSLAAKARLLGNSPAPRNNFGSFSSAKTNFMQQQQNNGQTTASSSSFSSARSFMQQQQKGQGQGQGHKVKDEDYDPRLPNKKQKR